MFPATADKQPRWPLTLCPIRIRPARAALVGRHDPRNSRPWVHLADAQGRLLEKLKTASVVERGGRCRPQAEDHGSTHQNHCMLSGPTFGPDRTVPPVIAPVHCDGAGTAKLVIAGIVNFVKASRRVAAVLALPTIRPATLPGARVLPSP